jgi:chitodextrinase
VLSLRKTAAAVMSIALMSAGLAVVTATPASATPDGPLSAVRSSMWQTNGDTDTLAAGGGVLYAGGRFTRVRPPGAAAGTQETARTYLAAFSTSTGALVTGFNVTLNGRVRAVRLSPDGTRLYIGGDFTTVNGVARTRFAAVNPTTGALITGFTANANGVVTTIAAGSNAVYVGGDFTTINGATAMRVASVNPTTGARNAGFTGSLDARPRASAISPDGTSYVIGGTFQVVNGAVQPAVASLDPGTGATRPWAATGMVPRALAGGGCDSEVSDIVIAGTRAYVVAEGLEPGCFEGEYAANLSDGSVVWDAQCLGASQATAVLGDVVYRGSHMHDCGRTPGGFTGPRVSAEFVWFRLAAHSISDGTFVHWSPNTNGAGTDHVGPHAMATDGTQLFVAGDFTSVGGQAQQGLTRFGPNGGNSTPSTPLAPTVTTSSAGTVTVTVRGVPDNNNGTLTYRLFRNGGTTPIATAQAESWPWSLPTLRFDDTGRAAGSVNSYRVSVSDGTATSALSPVSASVTASGSNPSTYTAAVRANSPASYWRFNEAAGPVLGSSTSGAEGVAVGGVSRGQAPAILGGAAVTLDGSTGYVAAAAPTTHSDSYSQTAYFKTTTRVGGTIMGYSPDQTGEGPTTGSDRVVFMENDGKIAFAQRAGNRFAFVRSATTFADGRWHQVTATYGAGIMNLYVDGDLQASTPALTPITNAVTPAPSYLRVGYTNLRNFYLVFGRNVTTLTAPLSFYFNGSIDEVADFPTELTPAQVRAMWAAGAAGQLVTITGETVAPSTPGSLSATTTSSSATLSWTASTDNVGVTGYQVRRDGVLVGTTAPGVLTFTDTGLSASTAYPYTVTAVDAAGNASVPASTTATTAAGVPDAGPPSTPGDLAATTTSTSVSLSWTASTDDIAVTGYEVRRDGTLVATTPAGTLSYTDNGRSPSTTYLYTVTAIDAVPNSSVPASLSVTTDAPPADVTPPSTPGSLSATKTTTTVTLSWAASTDNVGVTGYEVRRGSTLLATTPAGTLTFTDTGLTPATGYSYSVTAIDAVPNSSVPASVSVTTDAVVTSLFADTFTAANASPWSASWATGTTNGSVDVQGNAGRLAFNDAAGAFARAQLTGAAAVADSDVVLSYQWSAGTARAYAGVWTRGSGGWLNSYRPNNGYGVQLQSDSANVLVLRSVAGVQTTIATLTGASPVGTAKKWIRIRTVGSTIYVRTWNDGSPEPATWTSTVTDTGVAAAGQVFLSLNRSSTNVGAKAISVDDVTLTAATGP